MVTTDDLLNIGFEPIPHYTVTNSHIYNLGRNRHISVGCVGTPNEIMFICETSESDDSKITNAIVLHNYDYDGYLTKENLITLINLLNSNKDVRIRNT